MRSEVGARTRRVSRPESRSQGPRALSTEYGDSTPGSRLSRAGRSESESVLSTAKSRSPERRSTLHQTALLARTRPESLCQDHRHLTDAPLRPFQPLVRPPSPSTAALPHLPSSLGRTPPRHARTRPPACRATRRTRRVASARSSRTRRCVLAPLVLPPPAPSPRHVPFRSLTRSHPLACCALPACPALCHLQTVIQEARVFNETPISPRKCRILLTKIVYLLYVGETFGTQEATTLFFGVTKLFQHKDVRLALPPLVLPPPSAASERKPGRAPEGWGGLARAERSFQPDGRSVREKHQSRARACG